VHGISCIICAYNEGKRLRTILRALDGHPALKEVIVVDDGSTDDTTALVQEHLDVRLVSYPVNRGKTYAMAQGIAAATGGYLPARPRLRRLAGSHAQAALKRRQGSGSAGSRRWVSAACVDC
jgi:glycosyltransferase involved in cell wall biosynthesis